MLNYYLGTTIDKCNNMDEYQKSVNAKWKKPDSQEYSLYDGIICKPRKVKTLTTDSRSVVERRWGWETIKGNKRIFWGDGNVPCIDCGTGYQIVYVYQNSLKLILKIMQFIMCVIYTSTMFD